MNIEEQSVQVCKRAVEIARESDRRAYVDKACQGNPELRKRVDALLGSAKVASDSEKTITHETLREGLGQTIDRYKLLQQIGEGGFGIVCMAEQTEPVKRKVAIKVIKPGMDSRQVVARFEAERQALALMNHSNIAHVLDGGITGNGRPYFVMELVKGLPITDYCDKVALKVDQRLRLLIDVCSAIQHAHQKGIIHRDIKPSNILVARHDDRAVPKVIDFGVAKAIDQRLTEKTLFTQLGQMVGTPQYMSPEQAEMSGLDVDTRTDVYSLGIVLYELLTGTTPIPPERFCKTGYAEIQKMICEQEPQKPSGRLSTMGDTLSQAADRRATDAATLQQAVRGELDWIVLKALESDPSARYQSAASLAEDLQRYLRDEPVLACPPSPRYRIGKFVRRHRTSVAVAMSFAGLLILATVISTTLALVAWLARKDLQRELYSRRMQETSHAYSIGDLDRMDVELRAAAALSTNRGLEHRFMRSRYEDHIPTPSVPSFDERLSSVCVSPIGQDLVICDEAGNVFLQKLGSVLGKPEKLELGLSAAAATFSRDGRYLAVYCGLPVRPQVATRSGSVQVIEWPSRRKVAKIEASFPSHSFAISPTAEHVAFAGPRGEIEVHSVREDRVRSVLGPKPAMCATALQFSTAQEGRFLLAAGLDGEAIVWDSESDSIHRQVLSGPCWSLAVAPTGNQLATGENTTVTIWRLTDEGKLERTQQMGSLGLSIAYAPNGELLAAANRQAIEIWDVSKQPCLQVTRLLHRRMVGSMAFAPDGDLVSSSQDGIVKIWSLTGPARQRFVGTQDWYFGLDVSSDGSIAVSEKPSSILIWNPATGGTRTLSEHTDSVTSVSFSPDGDVLASTGLDGRLILWDLVSGSSRTLLEHEGSMWSVEFSPDGETLAASGDAGNVWLWDCQTWQQRTIRLDDFEGYVFRVRFSPTSRLLAAGGGEGRHRGLSVVWDVSSATAREIKRATNHADDVYSVEFCHDEQLLAVANRDCVLDIMDLHSNRPDVPLHTKSITPHFVHSMRFASGGDRLVTASPNGTIRFWRMNDQGIENVGYFRLDEKLREIAFTHDGTTLVTASDDGWVRIWPFRGRDDENGN